MQIVTEGRAFLPLLVVLFACVCEATVCPSIDIRNNDFRVFSKLENCTVIEGHLQILLIDNATWAHYENLTFPKLREITDYMLLYRAIGLQTLSKLFPNLAVIRGRNLISDFALAVFEMRDLQDLGLTNLTVIERGSVRITKNPNLCFADTIAWDLIMKSGIRSSHIRDNKPSDQCSRCPDTCPRRASTTETSTQQHNHLCWSDTHCQRICSKDCGNASCYVNSTTSCCHEECQGGCTGPTDRDCVACRKVSWEGRCMNKCPNIPKTFEYLERRCVTFMDCIHMPKSSVTKKESVFKPFTPSEGGKPPVCVDECPKDYQELPGKPTECKRCTGRCAKVCDGGLIGSVSQAQSYKDCTVINGSLEISVKKHASDVIGLLSDYLEHIEEITGYLKVARSNPLITLHFLKSLKVIRGQSLDRDHYSLLVIDNANLQELFPWNATVGKLNIMNGQVFFHMNPKLCVNKIDELKTEAVVAAGPWDSHDVSPLSNGDRIACKIADLNLRLVAVNYKGAMIQWDNFRKQLYDYRALLGYLIYYMEAPQNVSMFDGMDACGTNNWQVKDREVGSTSEEKSDVIYEYIPHLKPFTRYAIYVKTYTVAAESTLGGATPITYFVTKPTTPAPPTELSALSVSSHELEIDWRPPKKPNGVISYYEITGVHLVDVDIDRNYCDMPIISQDSFDKKILETEAPTTSVIQRLASNETGDVDLLIPKNGKCCKCSDTVDRAEFAEDETSFEDTVQNLVYVKRTEENRSKRSISDEAYGNNISITYPITEFPDSTTPSLLEYSLNQSVPEPVREVFWKKILANGASTFKITIPNLSHFVRYSIEVKACLEHMLEMDPISKERRDKCSQATLVSGRTLPLGGADDLNRPSVTVISDNSTHAQIIDIRWEEPQKPNGKIVAYELVYHRFEKSDPQKVCITRAEYLRSFKGWQLKDLSSGNYTLKVRASSLAGWGNYSALASFQVEDRHAGRLSTVVIVILVIGSIALVIFAAGTFWVVKKKYNSVPNNMIYISMNPEYMASYEPDEWEVDREKVEKLAELGAGSFGMVWRGVIKGFRGESKIDCAIKTVNDNATPHDRFEFLKEASVMKGFKCRHVVELLGVVSIGQPAFVLMELMDNGDLKSYLRKRRPDAEVNSKDKKQVALTPPPLHQLYRMACEIADGMAYLAAKKFVHRDLAGRNCMVARDLTVKIGDFGMTRDIYETDYYRKGNKGLLPVRWMAPESLQDGVFTSQSDVWSYGVVLWEMVTLAEQPYQGLSNEQVLNFVKQGGVMEKPENCPETMFTLMNTCWSRNPKVRPTFAEIIEILIPHIDIEIVDAFTKVSWYHTQRNQEVVVVDDECEETPLSNGGLNIVSGLETISTTPPEQKFFPTAITAMENKVLEDAVQIEAENECSTPSAPTQVNGGSKVIASKKERERNNENSKQSTQSSEGSKTSTTSNGSVMNGHVTHATTAC